MTQPHAAADLAAAAERLGATVELVADEAALADAAVARVDAAIAALIARGRAWPDRAAVLAAAERAAAGYRAAFSLSVDEIRAMGSLLLAVDAAARAQGAALAEACRSGDLVPGPLAVALDAARQAANRAGLPDPVGPARLPDGAA